MNARLPTALLVCGGVLFAAACQQILGIHGSQAARDGSADRDVSGASGGAGGTEAAASGGRTGGSGGAPGAGGVPMSGSGGVIASGGSGGSAGLTGSRGGAGGGSAGGGGGSAGRASGGAGGPGGSGGAMLATGGNGGGTCAAPWHAENVQARLLTLDAAGMTACSIAGADVPALAAAVDPANYRGAQACGACIRVQPTLSTGSVVVQVVELSGTSGVLLSKSAMDQIAPGASLTNVDWTLVACDVGNQPVQYVIKNGSNAGYVGIQVRNARYPIAAVAAVGSSSSVPLTLQTYDYWESTMAGAGPLTLRLTDINGQSFKDSGIQIVAGSQSSGQGQFPTCR